jgi:hypothetical protein
LHYRVDMKKLDVMSIAYFSKKTQKFSENV